jgi:hypothetical protein
VSAAFGTATAAVYQIPICYTDHGAVLRFVTRLPPASAGIVKQDEYFSDVVSFATARARIPGNGGTPGHLSTRALALTVKEIYMHQIPQPKEQARLLKAALATRGIKLDHQDALEVVATVMGFRSWQTMAAADFARAALLSKEDVSKLAGKPAEPTLQILDELAFYPVCWPEDARYLESVETLRQGLRDQGYTLCSQWFQEQAEIARDVPSGFDLTGIQARIDSGAMAFSLSNENHEDVSAYRFNWAAGVVELVNFGYSEELHDANAPATEGRFWYAYWRFDRNGHPLEVAHHDGMYSLHQAFMHLMSNHL